jgi:GNAT superfamily N-acetyltransferase
VATVTDAGGGAGGDPLGTVRTVIRVRRAVVDDAGELVRLRALMLAAMSGRAPRPGPWQDAAARTLVQRLADPDGRWAAFVVDKQDRPTGLAACVVGVIESRLGGPDNPSGEVGYVFNVVTEPGYRRRGYSRAAMRALLDWYRERGIISVDLRASPPGEPLYRELGFAPTAATAMRLASPARHLAADRPPGPGPDRAPAPPGGVGR